MLNTSQQALQFLDDIGSSTATAHLDTYHMNIEEPGMAAALDRIRYNGTITFEGFSSAVAGVPALRSDQRNAELIATTQPRADALIRIG